MRRVDYIITNEKRIEENIDVSKLKGIKVISKSGHVLGKLSKVYLDRDKLNVEGVLVRMNGLGKFFIGMSYIVRFSESAIILNIEPSVLIKGKKVIDYEGKILGIVSKVIRKEEKNDVVKLQISSFLKKKVDIPINYVDIISKAVILKEDHDIRQKYIWQRS